ncbi:MAG: hypothetical protein ABIV26_06910 [Candidatus Limnocylindrales bacterium]
MALVLPFPSQRRRVPLEQDLAEVAAAVSLVARGAARQVRLVNLHRPLAVAGDGAAQAGEAGVAFRLDRSEGRICIVVGPRR